MSDYKRLTKEETEHYEKTGQLPKDYNNKIIYLYGSNPNPIIKQEHINYLESVGIDQKIKNEISLFDIINNERKNDE